MTALATLNFRTMTARVMSANALMPWAVSRNINSLRPRKSEYVRGNGARRNHFFSDRKKLASFPCTIKLLDGLNVKRVTVSVKEFMRIDKRKASRTCCVVRPVYRQGPR